MRPRMFCCFRGDTGVVAGPSFRPNLQASAPQDDAQNSYQRGEPTKASALVDSTTSPLRGNSQKALGGASNRGGATKDVATTRSESVTVSAPQNVWVSLVKGLHQDASKQLSTDAQVAGNGDAASGTELRLPEAGSAMHMDDLIQQSDALSDPMALIIFDRTTKRGMRSRRVSPHLLMDINMEALFAGGVVPPPSFLAQQQGNMPSAQSMEAGGLETLPPQALLHLLQRAYCSAEAIRLSVYHSNASLMLLLGCSGVAAYESLLAELLASEHVLRAVLHDCCLCMLEGVPATSTKLMVHHPIHGTASRVVFPVAVYPVVVWRRPPLTQPDGPEVPTMVVALRYSLSAGLQTSLLQLHRVYAMLSSLSGIVTLFTLRGRVLHQNTASIRYMGLRQGFNALDVRSSTVEGEMTDTSGLAMGSILRQIFALSAEQLDDMLEDVVEGKTWKGIVRVPPLLTPTIDPGPVNAAILMARETSMSTYTPTASQAQVLSTWERLGPVLMSTQPGNRNSVAPPPSDVENHSEINNLASTLLMTQMEDKSGCGPEAMTTAANTLRGAASTVGAGPSKTTQGDSSTPDSCFFLAMGSTSGTNFSRMHNLSNLGTQSSSSKLGPHRGPLVMGRISSTDLPDGNAALAAALSAPTTPPVVQSPVVAGSKLAGSAPVVPLVHRTHSSIRAVGGTTLLRTLMENGTSILNEIDAASNNLAGGSTAGVPADEQRPLRPPGLTEAARRSIVRRRSALRLAPAEDNPLSTSTWGLLEGARLRQESKSFTVRRALAPGPIKRVGTEIALDRSMAAGRAEAASSLTSGGGGGGHNNRLSGSKKRPPSRLMSFLANKNIGATTSASQRSLVNNIWSASMMEGSIGSVGPGTCKAISSTTELELATSRPGSSVMRGLPLPQVSVAAGSGGGAAASLPAAAPLQPTLLGTSPSAAATGTATAAAGLVAALGAAAAQSLSPRRPPTRRIARPAIEDVAEESGTEQVSSRLQPEPVAVAALAPPTPLSVPGPSSQSRAATGSASMPTPLLQNALAAAAAAAPPPPGLAVDSAAPSARVMMTASMAPLSSQPAVLSQLTGVFPASRGSTSASQMRPSQAGGGASSGPSTAAAAWEQAGAEAKAEPESSGEDDEDDCWHEITASTLKDPVNGEQVLMLMQVDVTARVRAERRIAEVLEAEHKLLESVFPRHVLEMAAAKHTRTASGRNGLGTSKFSLAELPLAQNCASVATYHPMVTILFSDIIGFTSMCHEIPATKVMEFLNNLYSRLDTLLDVYGVYKVETIGDCYMVAGGLMTRDADGFMTVRGSDSLDELHAAKVMSFAKAMLRETAEVLLPTTGTPVQMRIGLHSGPVMSGIVGSKMPRFCLFGDTVNTASRMESTCPPGCIHVSAATREFLPDEDWEPTGGVMVKGKGTMETFRWVPLEAENSPQARPAGPRPRPRRASSVAYIHAGSHSRDTSGNVALIAHGAGGGGGGGGGGNGLLHGFNANGLGSGCNSSVGNCSAAQLDSAAHGGGGAGAAGTGTEAGKPPSSPGSSAVGPGAGRAASASIGFATGSADRSRPGTSVTHLGGTGSRGLMSAVNPTGVGGVAPPVRRKPHRCCSTTALAYRGMGQNKPV